LKGRMSKSEAIADGMFDSRLTARERAIFEGAITLGALYHQFVGIPVSKDRRILDLLERAISETMRLQPYKERVKVHINDSLVKGDRSDPFGYSELEGRMLEAEVVSRYKGYRAILAMKYVPKLKYNLMYVERVERAGPGKRRRSRVEMPGD
jgi:dihydroneopterin aldolase